MRLRQIALVAKDLAAARADISAVLGIDYAYDDPGVGKYGLRNAVFPIGDTFLEVVSPKEPGTTAGRLLEKRGGDGGYMVILQVDDLAQALARVKDASARIADQRDKDGAAFTHIHPKDIGGAILSLDRMIPKGALGMGRSALAVARLHRYLGEGGRRRTAGEGSGADGGTLGAGARPRSPSRMQEFGAFDWTMAKSASALERDGRGEGLGAFDVVVRDVEAVRAKAAARGLLDPDGTVVLAGTRVRLIR